MVSQLEPLDLLWGLVMFGIKQIASYVPTSSIDNIEQAQRFGETADFIDTKIGSRKLPQLDAGYETSDLAVAAVRELLAVNSNISLDAIDAIVVVTQNGDGEGLPHTAAIVQHKLGLPNTVAAFDVSLGCSGYVYGLYVLQGFLSASGLNCGLLITADPYSKVIDRQDRVTSLLFGDAATATLVGKDPLYSLGPVAYGTDGQGAEHLCVREKKLHMNGRQVFNFAALNVAPHIKKLLAAANLELSNIDEFLVHQGSAAIVDVIARGLGVEKQLVPQELAGIGNTVSSTIPLMLERRQSKQAIKNIVISGFGVGFSWASAILKREK